MPLTPAVRRTLKGTSEAQQCTIGNASAGSTSRSRSAATWTSTAFSRPKPDAVGTVPARTPGSPGSSSWTTISRGARHPAGVCRRRARRRPRPGSPPGRAPRRSASVLSPWRSSIAPASVHGPHTWILKGPSYPWADLLKRVEVAQKVVAGALEVAPRPVGEPPAGRLHLHRQLHQQRRRPPDHVGADPARGQLRQVRQRGQLAEDDLDRLRVGPLPRMRPDAGRGPPRPSVLGSCLLLVSRRDVGDTRRRLSGLPTPASLGP